MHLKRVIVAALTLPVFYLYISRLSPVFFLVLLSLVSCLAQAEFYSMYNTSRPLAILGVIAGVAALCSSFFSCSFSGVQAAGFSLQALVFVAGFIIISSARLFLVKDPERSLKDISPAVTGLFYVPALLSVQLFLRLRGYEWIIFLYGCVWASDSLAYYVGKGMGKKKLYREVSPNKTVAGAYGSVAGGMLSAALLGRLLLNGPGMPVLIIMGGLIGAVTIIGDLVESMFKRDAGIKDSGSIIPGHGGVLDKIDGVLFAGPTLYLVMLLIDI